MSPYFALYTVENNKNKKSVKFQGDMLNFCDFIQVFVFTRNHHLNTNHYEKRFGLHVSSLTPSKNIEGTGFGNDKSLHKILLYFAGFPFNNVT